MKIQRFSILIAVSAGVISGVGCQSAQKPASHLLPASKTAPPPIQQKSQPAKSSSDDRPQVASWSSQGSSQGDTASPAKSQAEAKPDPVAELIAKVEKEYQAGLDQYNAGQKDAAKEHFDRAFNMLLATPAEQRNDPRFQPEFDRVLESVNELELAALQQSEPA